MSELILKYDGLGAKNHQMDMRRFGEALVGLDTLVTYGVIAIAENRLVKRNEKLRFNLVAGEPKKGSLEIFGALVATYQALQGELPFLVQKLNDEGPEFLWNWIQFVLNSLGGRMNDANENFERLADIHERIHSETLADRQRERELSYEDREKERQSREREREQFSRLLSQVLEKAQPHAKKVVRPVGSESEILNVSDEAREHSMVVDAAIAETIRSSDPLELGDLEEHELLFDGITKHTTKATIAFVDSPTVYHRADIKDPIVLTPDNPYFVAFNTGQPVKVVLRKAYIAGEIVRVYVMGIPE